MKKSYSYDSFLYGVVYYPEQWPEARWDSDLSRIARTGMNVVRMGEGAWSVWEPEEGRYDFTLFDRALELCQRHNLKAIMGTPTYIPPAWLTERYPEVLRTSFEGTRPMHGSRRHYNYTSRVYRTKSQAITEALAQHYRAHPAVIGWQIDNESHARIERVTGKHRDANELSVYQALSERPFVRRSVTSLWPTVERFAKRSSNRLFPACPCANRHGCIRLAKVC